MTCRAATRYRLLTGLVLTLAVGACQHPPLPPTHIESLDDLSVEALRARPYHSKIEPVRLLDGSGSAHTGLIAGYQSDGLLVYTRIDMPPDKPPETGYPVLILVHGWYGRENAPGFNFFAEPDSTYTRIIDTYVEAGFIVLSPALRGHGTVNGIPAEGIGFLDAWDNGSYLSPMFYAIDILNLLHGIPGLQKIDWSEWGIGHEIIIDQDRISISGHSQGGDAVLTALAVSGEGSAVTPPLAAGSIMAGCFAPRFEQVATYHPMASTLQAFMAGDGSWNGTATGTDGSVNPHFVFGYPADWIGTVDPQSEQWTWQAETWSTPTVAEAMAEKFREMYDAINRQVADIDGAEFSYTSTSGGAAEFTHDPRIVEAMQRIGGFTRADLLTEPLYLHYSDQDYYSIPAWNQDLARRIKETGGHAVDFVYPGNTHSLSISKHDWFNRGEIIEGIGYMLERDVALFSSPGAPPDSGQEPDRTSIESLRRYADTLHNEFQLEYERQPLEGISRRVVRFTADGLRQYALVLQPASTPPENGWPVILMSHGYHPDPPMNGRGEDGRSDRPGDYYRGLPLAYAKHGFMVVWPDFRGHNDSEGLEFTRSDDPVAAYARDLVAVFRALPSLQHADTANSFLWGHSMGGNITLRALQALGNEVAAASVWSTRMGAAPALAEGSAEGLTTPLIIQHSEADQTVSSDWAKQTYGANGGETRDLRLVLHPGDTHLFEDDELEKAIQQDIRHFRQFFRR